MAQISRTQCCGIKEIDEIADNHTAHDVLAEIADAIFSGDDDAAFFFFSDIHGAERGKELSTLIKDHKLGTVTKVGRKLNPNSGNVLSMWVWHINLTKYRGYIKKTEPDLYRELVY